MGLNTEDVAIWASNVAICVAIVFANKYLMGRPFHFSFATTLSALHFLSCTLTMWAKGSQQAKPTVPKQKATISTQDLVLFTVVADLSIVCLNLSLLVNDVTFYQIAKLLVIPFVCFIEAVFFGRHFTGELVASIIVVIIGVGTVTVAGFGTASSTSMLGLIIAAGSVVFCGGQQILCRSLQQKHECTADELLTAVAPAQAVTLALIGPFIDKLVSGKWVMDYSFTSGAAVMLVISCMLAVGVNISQFKCLGRFTAGTFQVLGHTKTILVLLGGWWFLGDVMTTRRVLGMCLAVAGMMWYGKASYSQNQAAQAKPAFEKVASSDKELELESGEKDDMA